MPQISNFYGIVIFMNIGDHMPPHFHAWYNHGEYKISVDIKSGIVKGRMPGRAVRMVLEWLDLHHDELLVCWEQASNRQHPNKIAPLQ